MKPSLRKLFKGRDDSYRLYLVVETFIKSLDSEVKTEVMKTQVSFGTRRKFAWTWLPQLWTKNRSESSLTVTFDLDHRVDSPRIAQAVEPSPGKWTHHVVLNSVADFDDQVKQWIREAWQRSQSS